MNGLSLMKFLLAIVFLVILFVVQSFIVTDWTFSLVVQALLVNVLMLVGIYCVGGFDIHKASSVNLSYATHFVGALLGAALSIVPILLLFTIYRYGRVPFILSFLLVVLVFPLVTFIVSRIAQRRSYSRRFAVLLSNEASRDLLSGIEATTNGRISFAEFYSSAEDLIPRLSEQDRDFDAVLISEEHLIPDAEQLMQASRDLDIHVVFLPRLVETVLRRVPETAAESFKGFYTNAVASKCDNKVLRILDIVFASLFIVATSPFMIFSWLYIYFRDKGPVLDKEERIGANGRAFRMIRFNTSRPVEDDTGTSSVQLTKSGRIVLMLRFSELPRLFNVFLGDMSIVGPKPDTREEAEACFETVFMYNYRRFVRPGLAGYSQVFKMSTLYADQEMKEIRQEFDLFYVKNQSVIYYLYTLLRAFESIFVFSGRTRGVPEEPSETEQ